MSRDKQISEMKSIIDKAEEEYSEIWNEWFYDHKEGTKIDNEFLFFAKILYNAGYRKADEVAREIFEEIGEVFHRFGTLVEQDNSDYGELVELILGDIIASIAELKKKYIGKDTNVTTKESEKDE